jgi:aspartyl-tRNA(Asn)/glutamyl-tRNA(Gln) amidotransferase subunit C
MADFNKEELLKIAELSALKLSEQEVPLFVNQIKQVLDYINQIQQVPLTTQAEQVRNVNIMRADVAHPTNYKPVLEQAPQKESSFFIVPKIMDEKTKDQT